MRLTRARRSRVVSCGKADQTLGFGTGRVCHDAYSKSEIAEGRGPSGNFDKKHLRIVDGGRGEPIGGLSKDSTSFLQGSRIRTRPSSPIPNFLRTATPEQFAERAGQVLAELNYVHPFREGNGRVQEAFIIELGPPLRP